MPPVLDVALHELAGRGAQEVLAREVRPATRERHDVLELVAEAVGAARLVEGGARPEPARQRLVEQPAVEQDVHRAVGRRDLDRADESSQPAPSRTPRSVARNRSIARGG